MPPKCSLILSYLFLALFTHATVASSPFLDISKVAPPSDDIIANQFIVEFADPAALQRRSGRTPAEGFFHALRDAKIKVVPKLNFTSRIFTGSSFRADKIDISELRKQRSVKNVWQARKIPRPIVDIASVGKEAAAASPGSMKWTNHLRTGVMDLQTQGIRGKDVLIAVVDSGIDYMHPALGGGIGPDKKIIGGYDFVGDKWNGTNDPIPDDDPMDYNGHGTHVAGIIAASNNSQVIGVAPEARLLAYKVFSKISPTTSDDILIKAFLRAYDEGADIITASIAGVSGWQDSPWAAVASRLVEKGVFVSIAAGNQGLCGPGFPADGSSGALVTGVGSLENDLDVYNNLNVNFTLPDGTKIIIAYYDTLAWDVGPKRNVWSPKQPIGLPGKNGTACLGLPEDTPDLSNLFVLWEYYDNPSCDFFTQLYLLSQYNATLSFWWQDFSRPFESFGINGEFLGVKTGQISQDDGMFIQMFLERLPVTVSFADPLIGNDPRGVNNTISGGKMSYFSSWGLTNDLDIKPDISAPGGNIFSTYPDALGSYSIQSGTSMATPYIAGVAALFASRNGGRGAFRRNPSLAQTLRGKMINGGNGLPLAVSAADDGSIAFTDYTVLAPIPQQGGGYVNATSVVLSAITISPPKLALNDFQNFVGTHSFTIRNSGSTSMTFSLSHFSAATVFLRDKDQEAFHMPLFPDWDKNSVAGISFSSDTVSVPAGGAATFKVTFTPPTGLEEKRLPTYSGKLVLLGSGGDKFEIPYSGVAASLATYSPMRSNYPKYKFANETPGSTPIVSPSKPLDITYRLNLPSVELRLDVIEVPSSSTNSSSYSSSSSSQTSSNPTTPQEWLDYFKSLIGLRRRSVNRTNDRSSRLNSRSSASAFHYPPPQPGKSAFAGRARGKKSLWPRQYLSRDVGWEDVLEPGTDSWYGDMGDGVKLKDGRQYKIVMRALGWNGIPERAGDWFEYESRVFEYRKN